MVDFWLVLSAVGSIASLIGLLLPFQNKSQRILHVAYGLAVTLLAFTAVWFWQENQRIHRIEQSAQRLLAHSEHISTDLGFIQAALAFLEKNRDIYPDTYYRALEICKLNNCSSAQYTDKNTGLDHVFNLQAVAEAFRGLISGIGTLEGGG